MAIVDECIFATREGEMGGQTSLGFAFGIAFLVRVVLAVTTWAASPKPQSDLAAAAKAAMYRPALWRVGMPTTTCRGHYAFSNARKLGAAGARGTRACTMPSIALPTKRPAMQHLVRLNTRKWSSTTTAPSRAYCARVTLSPWWTNAMSSDIAARLDPLRSI